MGFNKPSKHTVVRKWIRRNDFKFDCLIETRVKERKAAQIVSSVFPGWSFMNNYEFNRRGRLWILWSSQVRLTPVKKTD